MSTDTSNTTNGLNEKRAVGTKADDGYGFDARRENRQQRSRLFYMARVGVLAAMSAILMLFEIPLPFAPSFYKLDLSEVPVLIGCFALGPVAAAVIEGIKILIHLLISGTQTAGVGEIANFLIGCAFCIPAGVVYRARHTKAGALSGMALGTALMAAVGGVLNAYVLLPVYAKAFSMPIDALVSMGTAVNSRIQSLAGFVLLAVVPFNIVKGVVVSLIVFLIYKKISKLLANGLSV